MPTYHFQGMGEAGETVEGNISALSNDDALGRLREKGIAVTHLSDAEGQEPDWSSVTSAGAVPTPPVRRASESLAARLASERANTKPRRLFGVAIAAAFLLGAFAMGYFAPITVYRCERVADGRVDCLLGERDLGIVPIREQRLAGVTSVDVESKRGGGERLQNGRTQWREDRRLVLANAAGASIRPSTWDQAAERIRTDSGWTGGEGWVGASTDALHDAIAQFLAQPNDTRLSLWQGQQVPLIISAVLAGIGLLLLTLGALSLFTGPTNWIYSMAERAAVKADERRRSAP